MKFKKIYVEITNRCNLNCSFCSKLKRPVRDMSIDEFRKVMIDIKPYTGFIYLHLKGEPLIHPNLEEILNIALENNIKVNITTNGTKLEENLDIIKRCESIRQINISLQALENVSDRHRYLENVCKLIKICEEKKIYINLRIWVDNKEVNDFIHNFFVNKMKELPENVYWSYDTEFEWPNIDDDFVSDYGTCLGTKTHIGILSDGDVVPCCLDGNGIITFGNVYKESLNDILNSDRFVEMREGFNKNKLVEELCKKCKYRRK